MAEVVLKNVKKIYQGGVVAVHDFNLDIADKEFIVFVGPSGCGKSTTLRMVAGLEEISEGTIKIDGEVVNDLQPKDRHISMVFQNYALYPHLTVFENMAFPLRLIRPKMSQDEIYRRVTSAAEILGITPYLTRKPKARKGGQRQRVAIGRAMVKDCKVFLMDEPLSNLDAKLRNQMRAEIILLRKKIQTTFIYVTHDQTEAMTLGDRIVIMKDGFIQQVGTPHEVFDRPANLFVAEFIGAPKMNTFPATLSYEKGKYYVSAFDAKIEVTGKKADGLKEMVGEIEEPHNIILGVRPEHITVSKKAAGDAIHVNIQVNEMMGSELHLHVLTDDNTPLVVRVPTIQLSDEERDMMVAGEELYLTFEGKVMQFFDANTQLSLIEFGSPKMNKLPVALSYEDGVYYASAFNTKIQIVDRKADDLQKAVGEIENPLNILLGVWPDHIDVSSEPLDNAIHVRVQNKDITDDKLLLEVLTDDETPLVVDVPLTKFSDEEKETVLASEELYLTFEGKDVQFFNAKTQISLIKY